MADQNTSEQPVATASKEGNPTPNSPEKGAGLPHLENTLTRYIPVGEWRRLIPATDLAPKILPRKRGGWATQRLRKGLNQVYPIPPPCSRRILAAKDNTPTVKWQVFDNIQKKWTCPME